MFGDHANAIIVEAYLKGFRDFNMSAAYEGMRLSAMGPRPNDSRGCIQDYLIYGYVPVEVKNQNLCLYYPESVFFHLFDSKFIQNQFNFGIRYTRYVK